MILFDDVVEILDLPLFHTFRQNPTRFEVGNGFGRGCMLLHVDDARDRFGGFGPLSPDRLIPLLLDRDFLEQLNRWNVPRR